jgi:rhodanese-related sulfurtransferase
MFDTLKSALGFGPSVDYKELISKGAKVIDVRSPGEYAAGHLKGSINIPLQSLPAQVDRIKKMNCPVILCCQSGMRASSAKMTLKANGIEVYNAGSWRSI